MLLGSQSEDIDVKKLKTLLNMSYRAIFNSLPKFKSYFLRYLSYKNPPDSDYLIAKVSAIWLSSTLGNLDPILNRNLEIVYATVKRFTDLDLPNIIETIIHEELIMEDDPFEEFVDDEELLDMDEDEEEESLEFQIDESNSPSSSLSTNMLSLEASDVAS